MATINAKDVAELRKQTGCGMMDCKNALVAANGDFEEAIKVLREKGMAATAKKASRIAADVSPQKMFPARKTKITAMRISERSRQMGTPQTRATSNCPLPKSMELL